jgi:hypothetical protein
MTLSQFPKKLPDGSRGHKEIRTIEKRHNSKSEKNVLYLNFNKKCLAK